MQSVGHMAVHGHDSRISSGDNSFKTVSANKNVTAKTTFPLPRETCQLLIESLLGLAMSALQCRSCHH